MALVTYNLDEEEQKLEGFLMAMVEEGIDFVEQAQAQGYRLNNEHSLASLEELERYVREEKVLTLEDAVRKMTALPAQILGLRDRGQIREGFAADLVIFDPAKVGETNTFEKPKSYPVGIPYTIVNGVVVIDGGKHTGARPGRPLLGRGHKKG